MFLSCHELQTLITCQFANQFVTPALGHWLRYPSTATFVTFHELHVQHQVDVCVCVGRVEKGLKSAGLVKGSCCAMFHSGRCGSHGPQWYLPGPWSLRFWLILGSRFDSFPEICDRLFAWYVQQSVGNIGLEMTLICPVFVFIEQIFCNVLQVACNCSVPQFVCILWLQMDAIWRYGRMTPGWWAALATAILQQWNCLQAWWYPGSTWWFSYREWVTQLYPTIYWFRINVDTGSINPLPPPSLHQKVQKIFNRFWSDESLPNKETSRPEDNWTTIPYSSTRKLLWLANPKMGVSNWGDLLHTPIN